MATILFSFAGSCIQKLQELIIEEEIQILGVKQELSDLQRTMTQIQCFLKDADRRRIEDLAVSNWIGELKDAMYDADDIIDMVRFKGSNLLGENSSSLSRKLITCNGFATFSCFSNLKTRHEIAVQIRGLNKRIKMIKELGTNFKFETEPIDRVLVSNMRKTSHLVEPNLVGKEIIHATNRLVGLVLEHRDKKAYKMAIVGTGGVGKTTLAQKIYNDQRVKGNFKKYAWICVSQQYSQVALLKEILRNVGVDKENCESIGELQAKLAEAIEGDSFFLVLDDLWESDVWTNLLRTPLNVAAQVTIIEEAIQILGVKQELSDLQRTMTQIQCFLKDADRGRIEDLAVSNWIGELKDAMYDADDIIDMARFKGSNLLGEDSSSLS